MEAVPLSSGAALGVTAGASGPHLMLIGYPSGLPREDAQPKRWHVGRG